MSEPLLRRACDRCHAQKLSCRKENPNSDCIRCIKANKACSTSASLKNKNKRPPNECASESSKGLPETLSLPPKRPRPSAETFQNTTTASDVEDSSEALLSITTGWDPTDCDDLDWADHHSLLAAGTSADAGLQDHDRPLDQLVMDWDTSIVPFSGTEFGETTSSFPARACITGIDVMNLAIPDKGSIGLSSGSDSHIPSNITHSRQPAEHLRASQITSPQTGLLFSQDTGKDGSAAGPMAFDREPPAKASDGTWLLRLMNMNVTLFQQGEKVGQLCSEALSSSAGVETSASDSNKTQTAVYDETFLLFFGFVRLLRQLPSSVSDLELLSSQSKMSSQPQNASGSSSGQTSSLDPASVLITLSCYIRILEICQTLLGVMQAKVATLDASPAVSMLQLPTLVISSGRLDDFPALQLKLVLETYENLLTSMRALLVSQVIAAEGFGRERRSVEGRTKTAWGKPNEPYGAREMAGETIHSLEDRIFKMIKQIRLNLANV